MKKWEGFIWFGLAVSILFWAFLADNPATDLNKVRFEVEKTYRCSGIDCLVKIDFTNSDVKFGSSYESWNGHKKDDIINSLGEPLRTDNTWHSLSIWLNETFLGIYATLLILVGGMALSRKMFK